MSPAPPRRRTAPAARVVRPGDLTAAERAAWVDLHRTHAAFASPYFHPAFAELAAAARGVHAADDVRVAVLPGGDPHGPPAGFFPFQRGRFGRSSPPAGRLCDAHGVVRGTAPAAPGADLLRSCRLRAYDFHMLPAANPGPAVAAAERREGMRANLAGGFDAWVARREEAGSKRHRKVEQFRRRIVRDRGDATVTWHDCDPAVWAKLIKWKRAQYAATGFTDVLAVPWVRDLLARCRDAGTAGEENRDDDFGGVLSTLRAGGDLLAVHFALRSGPRLHSWFPAYDVAARSLSPGNVLLTEVLKAAADRGVTAVDLGASDEGYKADYATETYPLCEGLAEAPGVAASLAAAGRRVRDALKAHPAGAPARAAAAWVRPLRERLSLR